MLTLSPPPVTADAVDAAKTYLRIENDEEDATLVSLIGAAIAHAEAFLNLLLLRRTGVERLAASSAWTRIGVTPVQAIVSVTGIPAEGAAFVLPVSAYALDIDGSGDGWVRVTQPGSAGRVDVSVEAGMASSWGAIPEPLRLAVLRLAGHLYAYRDAPGDAGPPAAVAALLRPWRRMRLH
jgi:uncharacterized phiE125 gp8 family phage protein